MATDQQHELIASMHCDAEPKWAVIVDDRLAPMPRRYLKACDILHQSAARPGSVLVRDYNSPNDEGFADDVMVDLAEGNVFRTASECDCIHKITREELPKLAFVVDDRWEVTIEPKQSGKTLRGLLAIATDKELLRDHESPNDEPIDDDERIEFADGPVFVTRTVAITVKINNNPVKFTKRKVKGLEIKRTAIEQGVHIELSFVLYPIKPDGSAGAAIADAEKVTLKDGDEFRCLAPDDNS